MKTARHTPSFVTRTRSTVAWEGEIPSQRELRPPGAVPSLPGFTLIEVIIALSLSLVLVSAIYSAVSLHWRHETIGRERIDRAQVSLAILRLMSEDIGSASFTPPSGTATDEDEGAASTGGSSSGGTSSSSSSTAGAASSGTASTGAAAGGASSTGASSTGGASATGSTSTGGSIGAATGASGAAEAGTAASLTPTSLGIFGTAETLQIDISHPVREDVIPQSITAPTTQAVPKLTDNVRVTWAMVTPSTAASDAKGLSILSIPPALARQLTDRLRDAVVKPDKATLNSPLDDASILAREVVQLQFQYYDGYAWVSEWDSVVKGRLPRAIEVTIGFHKPEYKRSGSANPQSSDTIVPIKHVILVPASTPVSGAEI